MVIIGNEKLRQMYRPGIHVSGFAKFTTTEANGKLPIRCQYLYEAPDLVLMQIPSTAGARKYNIPIGALSASADEHVTFTSPITGTISAVTVTSKEGIAAADTDYFAFGLLNKTGSLTPVDIATAANTTQATGGAALVAYTANALTINPTAAQLVVTAGDVFEFNVVHHGTPGTAQTEASVAISITPTAGTDGVGEFVYCDESAQILTTGDSQGLLQARWDTTLNSYYLTIARTGGSPTSNLIFGYSYEGLPA